MDATLIALGCGSLICLMPLGLYLLYLAYLNGRTPSTVVRGPWDLAALLLGLSGFLVLAGPMLLSLVDSTWRYYVYGNWAALRTVGRAEAKAWSIMATGWFFMWVGIVPLLLRARRRYSALYNVMPTLVEAQLIETLDALGYAWQKVGTLLAIDVRKPDDATGPMAKARPEEWAYVRIMPIRATAHALLRWSGAASKVRDEVEAVLPDVLARGLGQRNPVAGWFFTAAMGVMALMLVCMAVIIMVILTPMN